MKRIIIVLFLSGGAVFADDLTLTKVVDKAFGLNATLISIEKKSNRNFVVTDVPKKKKNDTIQEYWDDSKFSLMINGGYFESNFKPTGFYKLNGNIINSSVAKKLSGFVAISKNGAIHLLTKSDDKSSYPNVIQVGPYVIDPGGTVGIKSRNRVRARRTLIGITTNENLLIMITEPITLYDLAFSIKKKIPQVERLLNLDGGPSTALKTATIKVVNKCPVRNYITKEKHQQKDASNSDSAVAKPE